MPEEIILTDGTSATSGDPATATPAGVSNTENGGEKEQTVPYARFKEINDKLKQLEQAQEDARAEREKQTKRALEEQNKFKELYEAEQARVADLEPFKAQYEAVLKRAEENNTKRVEAIPENMRSLIPEYTDPMKLQAWLDANTEIFNAKPAAPSLNGQAGSGIRGSQERKDVPSDAEIREQAAKFGVNPRHLAEQYGVKLQG